MSHKEPTPIACTLAPGDFQDRVAWIVQLTTGSLCSYRRDGLTLHLTYDGAAAAQVRELVRREQACCSFLRFEVRESAGAIHLIVTATAAARDGLDDLFAHFCGSSPSP